MSTLSTAVELPPGELLAVKLGQLVSVATQALHIKRIAEAIQVMPR